jgi:O-antigen/teichoic acid export membrane protein
MHQIAAKIATIFPMTPPYIHKLKGDSVGATFARGAGGALIVNIVGTGLLFFTHIMLARVMGTSSYGNFAYAVTWLNILALFGKLGFETASLRFVGEYNGTQKWGLLKGFVERSSQLSLVASVVVALSTLTIVWAVRGKLESELCSALWIVCLILPLHSLMGVRSASLRALKHLVKAHSVGKIIRPLVLLCGTSAGFFLSKESLSAVTVMTINVAAFAVSLLFVVILFKKAFPNEAAVANPEHIIGTWIRVSLPMLLINAMMEGQSQMDLIIIGFFLDSNQIGVYAAAKKITMLISFGMIAVNLMAAPMISELWHQRRKSELQRMLTISAWGVFAFTMFLGIVMIIFGKQVLSLFGLEFTAAYCPLVILTIGRILLSFGGAVGLIMYMTGHQNQACIIMILSLPLNIALSMFLIPKFGINGAAISMSISLVTWNLLMLLYTMKKLRLNSTIFSSALQK